MPSIEFSKNIASIFSHNDIKEEIKYDIISRLVCKSFQALNTSILIYDSKFDKLMCRGSYISRNYFKGSLKTKNYEKIIMNIPVLEFFENHPISMVSNLTIEEFFTYQQNIDAEKFEITDVNFDELKTTWSANKLSKKYDQYKKLLRSESHIVAGSTFTGQYFENLQKNRTQLTSEVEVKTITSKNKLSKKYFSLLEKIGINSKDKEYIYIGAPLFATERYSGVLRIILNSNQDIIHEVIDFLTNQTELKLDGKYHERINSFSQIISLNLKTNFYLSCFRELSKLQIDLNDDLKIISPELDRVCNKITQILNCNGCLIRIKDDPKSKETPELRGISESLSKYKDYVMKLDKQQSTFSNDINRLFTNVKHNKSKLEAITFSLRESIQDLFVTKEYYYTKAGKLRTKTIPQRQFRDFTYEYKSMLVKLSMIEISIVPLKHFENSYIIFTNTKNRSFTLSDIEIMLLSSQRIGLEIKHTQETKRRNEEELDKGITSNVRIIEHQVGQMVKSSHDCIEQILYKNIAIKKRKYEKNEIDYDEIEHIVERLKLLRFLIKQAKSQILKRAGVERIESKQVQLRNDTIDDFWKFLKNKCLDFEPYAFIERDIHVWLTTKEEKHLKINTDSELLSEVLNNIIDNAIKYSFEGADMRKKNILFDESDYKSEGNILVSYMIDYSKIKISISNWGYTVSPNEYDSIFKKNVRGSNSEAVLGSGLGLYYVKTILDLLHGHIEISSIKNKTTFTITLNRQHGYYFNN